MPNEWLTRAEIKQKARAQLSHDGLWGQMMVANLLPWFITVVFTLIGTWIAFQLFASVDPTDLDAVRTTYSNGAAGESNRSLLSGLINLWFTQGVAFTALDVYRGEVTRVKPMQAVFRLFNGVYFFGVLALAVITPLLTIMGFAAFIIPGIIISFALSMTFYTYYDGRRLAGDDFRSYSVFQALGDSWRVMSGFKFDYFVLQLSLLGWYLLKAITLHLFDFMIDPYLQLVDAGFYDNVRQAQASRAL